MYADRLHQSLLAGIFFLVSLFSLDAFADREKRITMRVGEQISLSAKAVEKYSEGKKGVVDIRLPEDGEEFIVVGLKPGNSTLLLIKEGGEKFTYSFEVKATTNEVERKENVRLDFYFVELSEGSRYQVGVNWPGSLGGDVELELGVNAVGGMSSSASISNIPLPRLDVLHRGDWARIARQASIITANGEEAEFKSGGEVNIAIEGSLAAEIRQIPYGTNVRVLPHFDKESGRLEVRIDADVSSLGEGRVPSRSRSTVSTVVNVEMNQAIVLAGLYAKSESKNRSGLPFLSQLPVIGALFGSHGARHEELQNVIFIVPTVVDVVGMDARGQIRDALKAYERYSGELDDVSIGVRTGTAEGEL
ncbi:MAG: type II and III secretion system protein [Myxococcales bacterium]|nr:type II and III secretion system protein [Myxococcales bacterium]